MSDVDRDYGKEFWTIANVTVGFVAAQTAAFFLTVGPHDGAMWKAVAGHGSQTIAGCAAATVLYCMVVDFCHRAHTALLKLSSLADADELKKRIRDWQRIRMAGVILCGLGCAILAATANW